MFNGSVNIINASLKFFIKAPTQKANFNLYKKQISKANFKSFPSALFFSFCIYTKHLFMLSISFKSHLIRHSGTGCTFTDTQRVLEHFRHSESTRALGHSEGTQRAIGGHLGTQHLESTRMTLGHLRHLDTQTFRVLRNSGTWALWHFGT